MLDGLEEEGVPARAEAAEEALDEAVQGAAAGGAADARSLAGLACDRAAFDVGVGIAADGTVSLRHARLPQDHLGPPRLLDLAHLRRLGQDAGRIVKHLPLQHPYPAPID